MPGHNGPCESQEPMPAHLTLYWSLLTADPPGKDLFWFLAQVRHSYERDRDQDSEGEAQVSCCIRAATSLLESPHELANVRKVFDG